MDGYGKRSLVILGDAMIRHFVTVHLENAGYNVHAVGSATEALGEMKRRRFDVIIADYDLLGFDGPLFLRLSRMGWPETPLIVISDTQPVALNQEAEDSECAWLQRRHIHTQLLSSVRDAVLRTLEVPAHKTAVHIDRTGLART